MIPKRDQFHYISSIIHMEREMGDDLTQRIKVWWLNCSAFVMECIEIERGKICVAQ